MGVIDYLIVGVYLLGLLLMGIFARARIHTVDDYLVAGRQFNTFSLSSSITASLIGAGMVLSMVSSVYTYGAGMMWNYIGFAAGLVIMALVFTDPLRKTQKRTMAEILAGRFGKLPRILTGIIAGIYCLALVANCTTAMARLFTYLSDGSINIVFATVLSMAIGVALTALGGLYSVVWTDTVQLVIMVVFLILTGVIISIVKVGSLGQIDATLATVGGTLLHPAKNVPGPYIALAVLIMIVSPADPTVPQRALAGKTSGVAKKSFLIAALMAMVFGVALTIIGGAALALLPDVAETHGTIEAAMPIFILNYYPPFIKGLAVSGLIAAILSTLTSLLLVGTTHLVYDAGQALFPKIPDIRFKKLIPWATVVLGALMVGVSLKNDSITGLLYFAFSLAGAAFYFPLLLVLYWKNASGWGITAGLLGGSGCVVIMSALGISGIGGDPVFSGMLLSLVCCIVFSLLFPEKKHDDEKVPEVGSVM